MTADCFIKLLRATATDGPGPLVGKVIESEGSQAVVAAELLAGGKVCITCRGAFVAVGAAHPAYRRW